LRVISGTARGTALAAPKGLETRPTADMVRESLFNILQGEIAGRSVVDLFAGSGAFGIEALSRGALCAWFVDNSRECELVIKKNLEKCGFEARVVRADVFDALKILNGIEAGIVFADPPYGQENAFFRSMLKLIADGGIIKDGGVCLLERQRDEPDLEEILGFSIYRTTQYSNSRVIFLKRTAGS
jgi:16S rRNA (guanine966-N2)-methyltransferase